MTQDYYGTKKVTAWKTEGKEGEPGYGVKYEDGYVSWSPKEVFERAYQTMNELSFGHAIKAMKDGLRNGEAIRVARAGWNGKGMWLRLYSPYSDPEFSIRENGLVLGFDSGTLSEWIGMHTADNKFVPWLASQTDMLADDWHVVE